MCTTVDPDLDVDGVHPAAAGGAPPYVLPSRPLGLRPGVNVDKALSLAGALEDEEIRAGSSCASEASRRQPPDPRDRHHAARP
jgi:hypothetical protein